MFTRRDLNALVDLAGKYQLTNGWRVVIRAEWVDLSPGRPHGLSYAAILEDEQARRLLGFDNSHAYDGAEEDEPFDHEHRPNAVGRTFRYEFKSAGQLITDFWARCETHCNQHGIEFVFVDEDSS